MNADYTSWCLGLAILGPVGVALLTLASPRAGARRALVAAGAILTFVAGVGLAAGGACEYALSPATSWLPAVLEPAIVGLVLVIGYRLRSALITGLAFAQLVILLVESRHPPCAESAAGAGFVGDSLSLLLVLIVSCVGSLIVLYAVGYMRKHEERHPVPLARSNRFFAVLLAFLGLMNGLVLADDLRWLAVCWEGTTLCSFFLIGYEGTSEARKSARRALAINTFGGLALTGGGFLAGRLAGTESLGGLVSVAATVPLACLAVASMTKAAQLPFQSWLLGAMVAPTPVSALLHSSTMVKAGSYLVLRIAPALEGTAIGFITALAGAFTFAAASALAVGQSNGKRVLAYSTVANLGLIAACACIHSPLAHAAALLLLVFHALSKALLFLCVGAIEQSIGSRHIEDMGGILFKMPLTTTVAMIGMVSMMVPPFGMLIGKWMAIEAAADLPLILLLVVLGSAMTIFFWAKWLGRITTASFHPAYRVEPMSPWMRAVLVVMAAAVVTGSLSAMPAYHAVVKPLVAAAHGLEAGRAGVWTLLDSVDSFMEWPLFVALGLVALGALASLALLRRSHVRLPYLGGENAANDDSSFEFRSLADRSEPALLTSYYLSPVFGEAAVTAWSNPVAALILLTLAAAALR